MKFESTQEYAEARDAADELRSFRELFNFPPSLDGRNIVYLCGHSLGLQPQLAPQFVDQELAAWAKFAVEGHFRERQPWVSYHRQTTPGLVTLTGAREDEVVTMNTLTVNLHLLMTTFYWPDADRYKVVIESTAFPSDRFAVASQIRLRGFDPDRALLEWRPDAETEALRIADLESLVEEHADQIALLMLPGVQYYNGQLLDMETICRLGRDAGCAVGLDLAHAIGNVPLSLHDWGPDFAVWCTYKYLNSGPGSIGGAFIHGRHLDSDGSRQLLGWWGHEESTRFSMAPTFVPAKGADAWQLSTPPLFSLAPVVASLQIFEEAGLDRLRRKSLDLTAYLQFLLDERFAGRLGSITPRDARGCQLSLVVRDDSLDARALFRRLKELNVIGDWREPNVIRVAPVPLYNSYSDVYEFSQRLAAALDSVTG